MEATASAKGELKGFVFIETDRISKARPVDCDKARLLSESCVEPSEWKHVLDEVSLVASICDTQESKATGQDAQKSLPLLLGFVPWAPITEGKGVLSQYHSFVLQRCESPSTVSRLKGYRYLFQDKPAGTMLLPSVLNSFLWLAENNLTFDLGVDARSGGLDQLREACVLLTRPSCAADASPSYSSQVAKLPKIIINHLCKPNLRLLSSYSSCSSTSTPLTDHLDFTEWRTLIFQLAAFPTTYMKLSGLFSELHSQDPSDLPSIATLVSYVKNWTDVVFESFGARRVMFGSNWPVENAVGGGKEVSWKRWKDVVEALVDESGLGEEEDWVWRGTAAEAYRPEDV